MELLTIMDTRDKVIALSEGPIASDGSRYFYSKGERLYIDNIARHFKKVILISLQFRPGDPQYMTCIHSEFQSQNISFIEIPRRILEEFFPR